MAELAVKIKAIDELSAAFEKLSNTGAKAVAQFDNAGDKIGETFNKANEKAEKAGKTANATYDSFQTITSAAFAVGLTKAVNQIASAVMDMTNEFSRAESIIAKSTGAVGSDLNALSSSMMNVFKEVPNAIGDVATVLSTLNTATGETGKALEDITEMTLKYARVNNEDAARSASTLGRLMNALDLDASQLSTTMDQLTLASQMSGLGVNALSEYIIQAGPSFEEMGFSVERSIALFSSFYQAGAEPRELLSSLNILLNRMAQDGATNAEEAFDQLLESIKAAPDILSATTIASEAFGARVGAKVADDIRAGRFEIDEWVSAISNAEGTLARTGEAALTLEERWSQATNSISAAFMGALQPAISAISENFAFLLEGIGSLLNETPVLTYIIIGVGAAMGAAAAALAILNAALAIKSALLPILTGKVTTFGISLKAALGPIGLIAGAIGAFVAIAIAMNNAVSDSEREFRSITATSKNNYEAVQQLNSEYERSVATLGENHAATRQLAADLEGARAAYDATKRTIEELIATSEALVKSTRDSVNGYYESMAKIDETAGSANSLIDKYEELSGATSLSATEQQMLSAVVDRLKTQFPELAMSYDTTTGAIEGCANALRAANEARETEQRLLAQYDSYFKIEQDLARQTEERAAMIDERTAAELRYNEISNHPRFRADKKAALEELNRYDDALKEMNASIDEASTVLDECQRSFKEVAEANAAAREEAAALAAEQAALAQAYEEGMETIEGIIESIDALVAQYDAAYDAARKALDGTFGLFEKVEKKAGLSSKKIIEAWESQIKFFEEYNTNLQTLQDMNVDTDFLAKLSDGSQESAAQAAALTKELGKLSPEDAATKIEEINSTFKNLEEAKDTTASTMADIKTDFTTKLAEMNTALSTAVAEMDCSAVASQGAQATMDAYTNVIKSMESSAVAAAKSVATAVGKALSDIPAVGPKRGFSVGTPSAPPGLAWAGEDGPELINFNGGERVYTANESHRIATAFETSEREPLRYEAPVVQNNTGPQSQNANESSGKENRLIISFEGNSEIVAKGVDKESIWGAVMPRLKDAFINIITEDVFEEGEVAHVF